MALFYFLGPQDIIVEKNNMLSTQVISKPKDSSTWTDSLSSSPEIIVSTDSKYGSTRFSCVCSVCACLDLSVSSSSWDLGRAAFCDCGTPWTILLPFLRTMLKRPLEECDGAWHR